MALLANEASETTERSRLGKIGLGTLALGVGLSATNEASAEIIQFQLPSPVVLHSGDSAEFDLNHDGRADFLIDTVSHGYLGAIFQIHGHVTGDFQNLIDFVLHGYTGAKIVSTIGPADAHWGMTQTVFDSNDPNSPAKDEHSLIGLLFEIPGSTPHYGGLDVVGNGSGADASLTVYGGIYESQARTPIPGTPEPGSLSLLALGFAGVVAWKKRQLTAN
jgi:hypothetical protein